MEMFHQAVADMMETFGSYTNVVLEIHNEYGVGEYDPSSSEVNFNTPTNYNVRAIVLDYNLQSNGDQFRKGTLVEAGDKQVIIQPLNKTDPTLTMPEIKPNKDFVVLSGVRYKIVTSKPLNPTGNDLIYYELFVRK